MLSRLFVYGTLRPTESRWPAIQEYVADFEPATLTGYTIYSLPQGYPAIEPGDGEVAGTLLHLAPEHLRQAIAKADEIEGFVEGSPRSLYERVVVELADIAAYTYVFHPNRRDYLRTHGEVIDSGDWLERNRR